MTRRFAARLIAIALCTLGIAAAAPAGALAQSPPPLSVTAAALYAPLTGQILYGVNANRRLAIASTTKLMTALVTLQHVHHLSTVFTQNEWYPASVDSQIGLVPGERMSVHDLLLALMLPSADDAAEDLAYNVGHGSVARFVGMMNAEARALGLTNTHYTTPIGLDTSGNYSSAADLVKLARYDLSHSKYFARIVDLRSAVLHSSSGSQLVTNRNDLVGQYPWIDGVKTGHTTDAGYVLVASGHRDGMALISAVLGTDTEQSRDANTLALLDYGFSDFRLWTPVRAGQVLVRPTVHDQPGLRPDVVAGRSFARMLPRDSRLHVVVSSPKQLSGPLPAQAVIGSAAVLDGRHVLTRIPLVLEHQLPAVSGLTLAARFVTKPLTLLAIAAVAGLGALRLRIVRRRRRIDRPGGELEAA
ncbi:MAG TPA: D-alanyl-D-alanine carboxypeptidase family protein [Solirubrobacteraceae bacterium]|nr:D-alanyl-D-alanine carboxypeptidase family protein [Solirubrobacteraceae bacterium]